MAARDTFHDACVQALIKDGWTITNDPLTVAVGKVNLLIDIGAERVLAAERGGDRIAVEIKSFIGLSSVQDLKEAAGQFLIYEIALRQSRADSDRVLYLAIRASTYNAVFKSDIGALLVASQAIRLMVFDDEAQEVREWIS